MRSVTFTLRIMRRKAAYLVTIFIIVFGTYLFWGPLFPWSPFKPGFQRIQASRANIFIQNFADSDSIVYSIDELMVEVEQFHDLLYSDKVNIVIADSNTNMKRFAPWLKGEGYSVSLSMLNLVYIGPVARASSFGIKTYLKHELSHMLIDQNATFGNSILMHEQGWFMEGMAQFFSGHHFYSKSEFTEHCKRNNVRFTDLKEQNPLEMSVKELPLNYTYYQLFIEQLVNNHGLDAVQNYLKVYTREPENYKQLFLEIFGSELDIILIEFNSSLNL
jgi:hypothetical protein